MNEIINALLEREYYWTVAREFIEDAIIKSVRDNGNKPFNTLDDLDRHIRQNYI